jgi:hypothetical protein
MDATALPDSLVFRDSALAVLLQLAVSVVLVATGVRAIRHPDEFPALRLARSLFGRATAWLVTLIFGFATLLAPTQFVPAWNGLYLTRQGFEQRSALYSRKVGWERVIGFRAVPTGYPEDWAISWLYVPMIVEYRTPPEPGTASVCCLFRLSYNYGQPAVELARTLEAWRQRAAADRQGG